MQALSNLFPSQHLRWANQSPKTPFSFHSLLCPQSVVEPFVAVATQSLTTSFLVPTQPTEGAITVSNKGLTTATVAAGMGVRRSVVGADIALLTLLVGAGEVPVLWPLEATILARRGKECGLERARVFPILPPRTRWNRSHWQMTCHQ